MLEVAPLEDSGFRPQAASMMRSQLVSRWLLPATALLVAGCVPMISNPSYPREWSAATIDRVGACPVIAGTYAERGRLYIDAGIQCGTPRPGTWNCDLSLTANLGIGIPAVAVRIEQPDARTMSVALLNDEGVAKEVHPLQLGKDYECDGERLHFSATGYLYDDAALNTLGALLLTGVVLNHRRSFFRDADGNLVMVVQDDGVGFHVLVGFVKSQSSFVRWMPAKSMESAVPAAN